MIQSKEQFGPSGVYHDLHDDGLIPPFEPMGDIHVERQVNNGLESQESQPFQCEGEPRVNYEILRLPEERIEYVQLTDTLIKKIVDDQIDVVVYLYKSARPVRRLVKQFWDILAPRDENGQIPPQPVDRFVNIDREQWQAVTGRSSDEGGIDISKIDEKRIDELRKVFHAKDEKVSQKSSEPYTGPTQFDGKKVLIVDEVNASGDTMNMAKQIFQRAFPKAENISGVIWMPGRVRKDPNSGQDINTKAPIWYDKVVNNGRLVANRDASRSEASGHAIQRIGAFWLSTTFPGKGAKKRSNDKRGQQLWHEITQMARDVRDHKLLYRPSTAWSVEEQSKRIEAIDGISKDEYTRLFDESGRRVFVFQTLYVEYMAAKAAAQHTDN